MNAKRFRIGDARLMTMLAVACLFTLISEPAHSQVFRIPVTINGAQEVPPVANTGTGTANLRVNTATRSITGTVRFSGLTAPTTAGHIHIGAAGMNGPIIIPLVGGIGVPAGAAGVMRVQPASVLLPAQLTALRRNRLYINIHTQANLGGEIRGQIRFARAVRVASPNQMPMLRWVSLDLNALQRGMNGPFHLPAAKMLVN